MKSLLIPLLGMSAVFAFPHNFNRDMNTEGKLNGGCIYKRIKEACYQSSMQYCSDEVQRDSPMHIMACMSKLDQELLDQQCLDLLPENEFIFTKYSCAAEVLDACPDITDEFNPEDRCLHDLYNSQVFSEQCSTAMQSAWAAYTQKHGLPLEDTPTDKELYHLLVFPEHPHDAYPQAASYSNDYDDDFWLWIVLLGGVGAVLSCVLLCVVGAVMKKRRCQNAQATRTASAGYIQMPSATPLQVPASPTASAPPSTMIPVARPYVTPAATNTLPQATIIAMPANQSSQQQVSSNGYPALR